MGWTVPTPSGKWSARWRDPTGKERSKTFPTKKAAKAFLANIETELSQGTYVDPAGGKVKFGDHAARWLAGRNLEARTNERTLSLLRTHVLPTWRDWPLARIDYMAVQQWVTELGTTIAGTTVAKCYGVLSMVMRSAVRARLIAVDPTEGVHVQGGSKARRTARALSRDVVFGKLLPAVPERFQMLVLLCVATGLRWGECTGLLWHAVDLDNGWLRVNQVAVETAEKVTMKPYPKSRAGRRVIPIPAFALKALREHYERQGKPDGRRLVFVDREGGPLRRSNFRRRVWLPSLVRAGLLGEVSQAAAGKWQGAWCDREGVEWTQEFATEPEAVSYVALHAASGPRFHDLRHSYATWLVSDGVPVNVVQHALGHEQASTTLNLYTHRASDYEDRLRTAMDGQAADFLLTAGGSDGQENCRKDDSDGGSSGTTPDDKDPGTGTTPVGG